MNVETITSRQNPLMTHLRKLASSRSYRKKSGEYLCDGTKLLDEALKWGAPVQTAVFSDGVEIPTLPDTVRAVRVSAFTARRMLPVRARRRPVTVRAWASRRPASHRAAALVSAMKIPPKTVCSTKMLPARKRNYAVTRKNT